MNKAANVAGTRERLLEIASDLFAEKGYASASISEITRLAMANKAAVNYHFGSKEGIFLAMMGEALREFEATATGALGTRGSAEERILRFFDSMFALMLEHLDVMRVLEAIYYGPPQGAPFFDFEVIHKRFIEILGRLIREGVESGEFRPGDPDDLTWAILGPFDSFLHSLVHRFPLLTGVNPELSGKPVPGSL